MARSSAATSRQRPSTNKSTLNTPPEPLESAPESLKPFLATLSKSSVYITHIDPHPASFKRQIFAVPVLLNILFLVFLAARAAYILPWYTSALKFLITLDEPAIRSMYAGGIKSLLIREIRHFVTVLLDYALIAIVLPWPWSFFFARPGNPIAWRWHVGFKDKELVVRVSRDWSAEDLVGGEKKGGESAFWKTRVMAAVQMDVIGKTGYLLMGKDWDLDFAGMVVGQKMVDEKGGIKMDEVNGKLWCWWTPKVGAGEWVVWDFRRDLYGVKEDAEAGAEREVGDVDEGRRMIMKFKDKLEEMGKEELFYKWVELIQWESSRPGGFTKERQIEAGQKVKELFDQYQVDFEEFEQSVGIQDGRLVEEVD
ncbi:hypothetical protein BT63DRAFT_114589 [Microthyrium microscopicum]|uniref:Uncharacterized protein n=1 Tax=Microthyrium microscopicum TaxID=703497 RepID=A0A6A6TV21_9PEZI|nr:hypothetical protein BT63DRAFT_114589 [Microthyrium microscopicum]